MPQTVICTPDTSVCDLQTDVSGLQPVVCSLHFDVCTLHLSIRTLHSAASKPYTAECRLQMGVYALHLAVCTLHLAVCTLHPAASKPYTAGCRLQIGVYALQTASCRLQRGECAAHCAPCTVHSEHDRVAQSGQVGHPVQIHVTVRVVDLVLEDAGGEGVHLRFDEVAGVIDAADAKLFVPRDLAAEEWDAETAFPVGDALLADSLIRRVEEDAGRE